MPESVTDRCTSSHEHILLFAKQPSYFYDAEAVRQPYAPDSPGRYRYSMQGTAPTGRQPGGDAERRIREQGVRDPNPNGANLRDVWTLGPEPQQAIRLADGSTVAHYAAYPSEIPRRAILAGTSAAGVCPKCGKAWKRVVDHTPSTSRRNGNGWQDGRGSVNHHGPSRPGSFIGGASEYLGWAPGCCCDAGAPIPATVLDPFVGSGTTAIVARQLGRRCIGIDLSTDYLRLAVARIEAQTPNLFALGGVP